MSEHESSDPIALGPEPPRLGRQRGLGLSALAERWLKHRTDLEPETHRTYRRIVRRFVVWAGARRSPARFTRANAADYRAHLGLPGANGRVLSEPSVCLHVRVLKAFWGAIVDQDLAEINPFGKVRSNAPRSAKAWREVSDSELAAIMAARPDYATMFALARWAGLRCGECLRLEWGDIDRNAKVIRIRPDQSRGGRITSKQRPREVPIRPQLMMVLEPRWAESGLVCPVPAADKSLGRTLQKILVAAGVVYDKPMHTLRKCCETEWLLIAPVMDVVSWMGHSPQVAAEFYHRTSRAAMTAVTKTQHAQPAENTPTIAEVESSCPGTP